MSSPPTYQDLQIENQQLKGKYKKALQQLMTVLQINKTLKESTNQNSSLEASRREDSETLKKAKEESAALRNQIAKNKTEGEKKEIEMKTQIQSLSEENHRIRSDLEREKSKGQDLGDQMNRLRSALRSAHENYQYEITQLKSQNIRIKKEVQNRQNDDRQRQNLENQLYTLKDTLVSIDNQRQEERSKWRREKNQLQQYYVGLRRQDNEKLSHLQFKYSLLESQLNQEKSIDQFLRNEERQMKAEQEMFQNVRGQIEKINQDWMKIQQQKNGQLQTLSVELANNKKRIAEMEVEKEKNQQQISRLKKQVLGLQKEIKQNGKLQQKISLNQSEKKLLLEKNNVLEALTMIQKHRQGIQVSERIDEFERRVNLLLEEKGKNLQGMAGIQQIIILKSYIRELSELVSSYKHREEKLTHSKSVLKTRQKSMEKEYKGHMLACSKKMKDYDVFFKKIYSMLESKLKEKVQGPPEHEVISTIHKYEELTIQMSEQIRSLKSQLEVSESKSRAGTQLRDNCEVALRVQETEIKNLKEENKKLQFHCDGLEIQNKNMLADINDLHQALAQEKEEAVEVVKQKDHIISGLTSKNQQLEALLQKTRTEKKELSKLAEGYSKQVEQLHAGIANKNRKNSNHEQNFKNDQELAARISSLEEQVIILSKDKEQCKRESIELQLEKSREYELKFWEQNEEIAACKAEIQRLEEELAKNKNIQVINESQEIIEDFRQQIFNLTNYKDEMEKKITQLTSYIEQLKNTNQSYEIQLTHKERQLQDCLESLRRKKQESNDVFTSTKKIQIESEEINLKSLRESRQKDKEISNLNQNLLNLRTINLGLQSDVNEKENIIRELKQENYQLKLQQQKQRSSGNISENQEIERLKALISVAEEEKQHLKSQNEKLLMKYQELEKLNSSSQLQNQILKRKNKDLEMKYLEYIEYKNKQEKQMKKRQKALNDAIQNNTSIEFSMNRSNSSPKSPLLRQFPSSPHPDYQIPSDFDHKIEIIPQAHLNEEKCKVVESYDVIPVNEPPTFKPGAKSTIYGSGSEPEQRENPSFAANFDRKRNEVNRTGGFKRSIKAIKISVSSNGEISSPLISNSYEK